MPPCVAQLARPNLCAAVQSVAVQRSVKECYLCVESGVSASDRKKVMDVFERCAIPVKEVKASEFKADNISTDLAKLLKGGVEQHFGTHAPHVLCVCAARLAVCLPFTAACDWTAGDLEKTHAMSALACLIKQLDLKAAEGALQGKYSLSQLDLAQFMKLDQAAVHALNLFPQATDCAYRSWSPLACSCLPCLDVPAFRCSPCCVLL